MVAPQDLLGENVGVSLRETWAASKKTLGTGETIQMWNPNSDGRYQPQGGSGRGSERGALEGGGGGETVLRKKGYEQSLQARSSSASGGNSKKKNQTKRREKKTDQPSKKKKH